MLVAKGSAKGEVFWGIQIQSTEPEPGMQCICEETGAVFRVEICGVVDSRAHAAGKRIVRFYVLEGDDHLKKGFRMIPQRGTERRA